MNNDWNIYIDSDALVHPDIFDITNHLSKDTISHSSMDKSDIRWRFDEYFLRDGRFIGSSNWFTICSDWCLDLWRPLDDLTPEQAYDNIFPVTSEIMSNLNFGLIDDYTLSRNIAKYGLKFVPFKDIFLKYNLNYATFLSHRYAIPIEEKILMLREQKKKWNLI